MGDLVVFIAHERWIYNMDILHVGYTIWTIMDILQSTFGDALGMKKE